MISDELAEELNAQIRREFESASYYLSMAADLYDKGWNGFANFMKVQAQEELEHGMKFFTFLDEVDERIFVPALEQPKQEYDSIEQIFETALEREKQITANIHDLLRMARENDDFPVEPLLEWFVDEQIEEEDLMGTILDRVRKANKNEASLFMLDQELGRRQPEEENGGKSLLSRPLTDERRRRRTWGEPPPLFSVAETHLVPKRPGGPLR